MSSLPEFKDINISTKTIISVTNLIIDLNLLFKYLPITEYIVIPKKRGRKKKVSVPNPNIDVPAGSIICMKSKTNHRGTIIKQKKSKTGKYFLNSVTVEILLNEGKLINIKVSNNGKFQITGCKDDKHFVEALTYLFHHMDYSQRYIGEPIFTIKDQSVNPRAIFNVVMKNIDFNLKFGINRHKLDEFITQHTSFISLFEDDNKSTYVNIKLPLKEKYDKTLNCMTFDLEKSKSCNPYTKENLITESKVDFSEYLELTKDRAEKKDDKYHTFLVFQSGAVIQSGRGPEMEHVHNQFVDIIFKNRKEFEERIEIV